MTREEAIDKLVKANIYLLQRYGDDLAKEFGFDRNSVSDCTRLLDMIAEKMDSDMPNPWYSYVCVTKEGSKE